MSQTLTESALLIAVAVAGKAEGEILHPYRDAVGIWTIGHGNRCLLDGSPVTQHTASITAAEADALFEETLRKVGVTMLSRVLPTLRDYEAGALLSFTYNVGNSALVGSTLLRDINATRMAYAGSEFLKWDRAGGKVLAGLVTRRAMERDVFLNVPHSIPDAHPAVLIAKAVTKSTSLRTQWTSKPDADDLNAAQLANAQQSPTPEGSPT